MKGATGDLGLTLATIREVLGDFEAREVRGNIKLDKPQGRAFVAKQLGRATPAPAAAPPRTRGKRGDDPPRHARDKGSKAQAGAWNNSFVKCRHCGRSHHWHRDCPKRRKAKDDSGGKCSGPTGAAAYAAAEAEPDEKLEAAIGDVLLASDARPRSIEVGSALCVRDTAGNSAENLRLTPDELAAQDERELAIAECKAELAGYPLHSEDARTSDDSDRREPPEHGGRFYAYQKAGGFAHDQSVYGDCEYSTPKRKAHSQRFDSSTRLSHKELLVPFKNVWPDASLYDLATLLEAIDIHNEKLTNRQAKRKAVAAKATDNDPDALFALRRIKKLAPLCFRDTLIAHCRSILYDVELARARARPPATPLWGSDKIRALARRAHHDGFARYRDVTAPAAGCTTSDNAKKDAYRRYDTGEPHPLDGEASRIVGYVD
eukprot:6202987-Pleurochrysis_carterae.AAC.3